MISDEVLAAIVEAGEKATPRPWSLVERGGQVWLHYKEGIGAYTESTRQIPSDSDRPFVYLAANHAVEMAQEIRRLREEMDGVLHADSALIDTLNDIQAEVEKLRAEAKRLRSLLRRCDPVTAALANGDYTPEMIRAEQEYRAPGRQHGKTAQLDAAEQAIREQNPDAKILRARPDTDTSRLKGNTSNIFNSYTPEMEGGTGMTPLKAAHRLLRLRQQYGNARSGEQAFAARAEYERFCIDFGDELAEEVIRLHALLEEKGEGI